MKYFLKNKRWQAGCYVIILLVGFFVLIPKISLAVEPIMTQVAEKDCSASTVNCATSPDDKCCGNFTLNDFIVIAVAVSKWILGITGSLALLMFIYGGVMFLISSGSSEKVTQAKQIIIGAVIGLIIVFAAYIIIGFTFKAMGLEGKPWNQSGWFK